MTLLPQATLDEHRALGDVICRSALTFQGAWRVGAFRRRPDGAWALALDGFTTSPAQPTDGGWNASFALPFTVAWWSGAEGWVCLDAQGERLAWTAGGVLHTPEGSLKPRKVRLLVAEGWEHRQVSALTLNTEVIVVVEQDGAPLVDPAYDQDLLSADTAWLDALGRSLAEALGCPFVVLIEER